MSVTELRNKCTELNEQVLSQLKEQEFACDLSKDAAEDHALGFMGPKILVSDLDLANISLSPRFAVRELRSKGWRTIPTE